MQGTTTSLSLLDGIRKGEADSWSRFVKLYGPLVYSKCRKSGCSEADASDISQEVFLRLHKSIGGFRPDGREKSFTRWLSTVVKRVVIDHYREADKTPKAAGGTGFQAMLLNEPDRLDQSLSFATESDRTQIVRRALQIVKQDVTDQTWRAFKRTVLEEATAPEVANELGMSPAAVRKAKSRVNARLKEILSEMLD